MLIKKASLLVMILCFLTAANLLAQEEQSPITETQAKYEENRARYQSQIDRINLEYKNQADSIELQIESLKESTAAAEGEARNIETKINEVADKNNLLNIILSAVAFFFYPVLARLGFLTATDMLFLIATPLLLFNVCLYTFYKEKNIFKKYRKYILGFLLLFVIFFTLPALAQEESTETTTVQQPQDNSFATATPASKQEIDLVDELDKTSDILSKNEYQKFISILLSKVNRIYDLPKLNVSDPFLKPLRKVAVDSAEYWFTLAALYNQENNNGYTKDALRKISENEKINFTGSPDFIVNNSVRFLVQNPNRTSVATDMIASHVGKIKSVSTSLALANFLRDSGLQESEQRVLESSIEKAKTVQDLVDLGVFFIKRGDQIEAYDSFLRASKEANNVSQLLLLSRVALAYGDQKSLDEALLKLARLANNFTEELQFVDLLIENGRIERSKSMFNDMIGRVNKRDQSYRENLLYLVNEALQRGYTSQAADALTKLSSLMGGNLFDYNIAEKIDLPELETLPEKTLAKLPHAHGLIYEKMGEIDTAQVTYMYSLSHALQAVLKSYGYDLPKELNTFYLLGNNLKVQDKDMLLSKLDKVYTLLEQHRVKEHEQSQQQLLEDTKTRHAELISLKEQARDRVIDSKERLKKERERSLLQLGRQIVMIAFYLIILIAAFYKAVSYIRKLNDHKAFGFFGKSTEIIGWLKIMSIFAIPTGVILVVFGQLQLIIQRNQEANDITAKSLAGNALDVAENEGE